MAVYVGAMLPDRSLEECLFNRALISVATNLYTLGNSPEYKRTPDLDLTFLLPSQWEKPNFEGMCLRSFSQDDQMLTIESAVPEKMLESDKSERYIVSAIQDAIDAADIFFKEQSIIFNAATHLALTEQLMPLQQRQVG